MIAAAASIPEVTAVATIGAPFDPAHISNLFPAETLAVLRDSGALVVRPVPGCGHAYPLTRTHGSRR